MSKFKDTNKKSKIGQFWIIGLGLLILYLLTHLVSLTALPVFADESIYIRWAQLIMDEPARYLFFALNDGKTPLFIWSLIPFQYLFADQLFAARFVSVLVGLGQVGMMAWLAKELGGKQKAQILAALFTIILPFWYFHHRMALMDSLLTFWLSLTLLGVLKLVRTKKFFWFLVSGFSFGLALWTKLPAILFIPAFMLYSFIHANPGKDYFKKLIINGTQIGLSLEIGLLIFLTLKLNPAFGQLFSRGGDFLYPLSEVLAGRWWANLLQIPKYLGYLGTYLTWPVLLLPLYGLYTKQRKKHFVLLSFVFIFMFPIVIMGKTVYPRYFMPVSLFITLSAALALESLFDQVKQLRLLSSSVVLAALSALITAIIINSSFVFILYSLFSFNHTPFVAADQEQYLHEWSSGHGVKEATQFIQTQAQTQTVAVATEGSFGTLPDGVLLYLHGKDVSNIYIEGIGQPVASISPKFIERAKDYDLVYLLVNSHRMKLELPAENLVTEYQRPDGAPSLQLWKISSLIRPKQF